MCSESDHLMSLINYVEYIKICSTPLKKCDSIIDFLIQKLEEAKTEREKILFEIEKDSRAKLEEIRKSIQKNFEIKNAMGE